MKITDAITQLQNLKPNQYDNATLVGWLSNLDGLIYNEIIKWHENTAVVEAYDVDGNLITDMPEPNQYNVITDLETVLLVPEPYSDVYIKYLSAQVDYYNAEFTRYNNSMVMYNTALSAYSDYYNRTHMPKQNNSIKI